jgi:dolichyl-phosphate beta-glucosyltransferase
MHINFLSIIVPAFNEEKNIVDSIENIKKYFSKSKTRYEIIVVDDGSSDNTADLVRKKFPDVKLIVNPENRGKGFSVRQGVINSKGDAVFIIDTDLYVMINEFSKLRRWYVFGYPFCIGSKKRKGCSRSIDFPISRKILGRFYSLLVKLFLLKGIEDTQCGFKLYEGRAAREIFSKQKIDGFGFDVETLLLAKRAGIKIKEIPLSLRSHPRQSKVNIIKAPVRMFVELLEIKRLYR